MALFVVAAESRSQLEASLVLMVVYSHVVPDVAVVVAVVVTRSGVVPRDVAYVHSVEHYVGQSTERWLI